MREFWRHPSVKKMIKESRGESNDPLEIIREKSREIVLQAFSMGWTGPPFDPIELAKLRGIEVNPNELVVDARIIPLSQEKYKIEYNPMRNPSRINFSLAHEIGHTLFSDCGDVVRNREKVVEKDSWELEFLCNVAASELLLPYAEFSSEANSIPITMNSIIAIANKYSASIESVLLRFTEVVDKPCAIAIASFDEEGNLAINYSKSSQVSNLNIEPGYHVPTSSSSLECLKSGWTAKALESWDVFGNTRYHVHSIGLTPLKKQISPRIGLLFVPEFYESTPSRTIEPIVGDATIPRGDGTKIIAQLVNTSAATGMGFGRALTKKFPIVKKALTSWKSDRNSFVLGKTNLVQLDSKTFVFQMLAQKGIKPKYGETTLRYNSLRQCLQELKLTALELNASVHAPAIGAGQAGGSWEIIKGMIYDELARNGVEVKVYMLPGANTMPKQAHTLTLFDEDSLL